MENTQKRKSAIFNMNKTLMAFSTMLLDLNKGNNLVLGGSCSMVLHGLVTKDLPGDVDIIIYKPTKEQDRVLDSLRDFNTMDNGEGYFSNTVYKFKKTNNGVTRTLDVLIQEEPLPNNLLWYINGKVRIRIQDIYTIIAAKAGYGRTKDYKDLLNLKNLNFNI